MRLLLNKLKFVATLVGQTLSLSNLLKSNVYLFDEYMEYLLEGVSLDLCNFPEALKQNHWILFHLPDKNTLTHTHTGFIMNGK